jgi:hypothetical protein
MSSLQPPPHDKYQRLKWYSDEGVTLTPDDRLTENYNPDQPRHPAGTAGGGRFAPGSGAGGATGSGPAVRPNTTRLKQAGASKQETAEISRLTRERSRLNTRIKEGTATTEEVRRRKEVVDEIAARKKAVKERVAKESAGSKTIDTAGNVTVKGGTAGPPGPGGFLRNREFLNSDTVKSHDEANRLGDEALNASARAANANTHRLAALAHRKASVVHAYAASSIENDLSSLSGPAEVKASNREAVATHRALAAHHQAEAEGHEAKAKSMTQANPGRQATPLTIKEVQDHMAKEPLGNMSQVMQLMQTHHGESGLVIEHGMSKPEEMEHLDIGGIKFHYPRTDQGREAAAGTIAGVVSRADKIPAPLWKAQTDVIHSSDRNSGDNYWAGQWKDPGFRSNATGGDGKTVVYGMELGSPKPGPYSIDVSSFAHEAGHNFATKTFGDLTPTVGSAYHAAQQKESPVTDYAKNAPSEDFAEAAMMYTVMPKTLQSKSPLKHKAFHDLMEQHGGGVAAPRA